MAKLVRIAGSPFLVLWLLLVAATSPVAAAPAFELDCGEGRVVTGISGAVENFWGFTLIGALRVSCVSVAPNGIHAASPHLGPSTSTGDGGSSFSMSCPPGHAVDRIFGTKGWYVDSLAVFCRSLTGDNIQTEALDHVGGNGGETYDIACPNGEAARGLTGTSGAVIDTLDLKCQAVPYGQIGEVPSLLSPASNYQAPDLRPAFHWTWPFPEVDPTHIAYSEVCLTTQAAHEAGEFCDVGALPASTAINLAPADDLPVSGTVHWTARGCNLIGECGDWQSQARWLHLPGDDPPPPPGPELPTATFEADLYPVYAHPRCTNCHGGYNPFGFQQGDSVLHPGFAPNNEGNAELCANCHQIDDGEWQTWKDPDDDPGQIPLFAIWQADFGGTGAPARDADDICATVRSEVINHQWDAEAFHEHVENDPLIGWSFEPEGNMDDATEGEAASDVMPRADWVAISMGWFEAGMPCAGEPGEVFAYEPAVGSTGFSASLAALLELTVGSRATQYLKLGAILPKDVREPKPRPRPDPFPRTKSAKRPAQKDWVINPVKGTLTKERVELLERAGLHPRFAPFEEVRKVLAPTARQ